MNLRIYSRLPPLSVKNSAFKKTDNSSVYRRERCDRRGFKEIKTENYAGTHCICFLRVLCGELLQK